MLGLAKSAVSQNLKRLEADLGLQLAVRSTRRLSLTPAGERYYQKCRDIQRLAEQARHEMEHFGAAVAGPLTLTAPHALVPTLVAPALAALRRQHPGLCPNIIAEDQRLDLIADGIDLAITVGGLPDSNLRARRIGTLHDILCLSPDLTRDAPAPQTPGFADWVQSLPYIAHKREAAEITHHLPVNHDPANSEMRTMTFTPALRGNTIEAVAAFARSGLGLAQLPDLAISDDLEAGRLVSLCGSEVQAPKPIYALHPYGAEPPRSLTTAIDILTRILQDKRATLPSLHMPPGV